MKKGGANADLFRVQQQIMQNSMGLQDYMSDLNSWMGDMNKNEKAVTQAKQPVSFSHQPCFWNILELLLFRKVLCHCLLSETVWIFQSSSKSPKPRFQRKSSRRRLLKRKLGLIPMIFSRRRTSRRTRRSRSPK
jgi:hypothetical protein